MLKITYISYLAEVTVYFDDDVFKSLPEKNLLSKEEKIKFLKELCAKADTKFARYSYPNHFHVFRIRQKEEDSHLPKEERPYYLTVQDYSMITNEFKIDHPVRTVDQEFQKIVTEKMKATEVEDVSSETQELFAATDKILGMYKGEYFQRDFELFDKKGEEAYFEQVAQSSSPKKTRTLSSAVQEETNKSAAEGENKADELTTIIFPSPKEPESHDLEQEYDIDKIDKRIDQTFSINKQKDIQEIQQLVRDQSELLGNSLHKIMSATTEIQAHKENLKNAPENFDHDKLNNFADEALAKPIDLLQKASSDFEGQIQNLGKTVGTFSTLIKAYAKNYEVNKNKLRLFNRIFAYVLYNAAVDYYRELHSEANGNSEELRKSIEIFNNKFGCIKIKIDPVLGRISPVEHVYNYFDNLNLKQLAEVINSDKEPKGLLQLCNTTTFNFRSMTRKSTSLTKIHEHLKDVDDLCTKHLPAWKGPFFTLKGKTEFAWTQNAVNFESSQNANCEDTMKMLKDGDLFKQTSTSIKENDDLEKANAKVDLAKEALKTALDEIKNKKGQLILQAEGENLLEQAKTHQQEIQKLKGQVFNFAANIMGCEIAEGSEQQRIFKDLENLVNRANEPVKQTVQDVAWMSRKLARITRPSSSNTLISLNEEYMQMYRELGKITKNKELAHFYYRSAVMMHATFFIDETRLSITNVAKEADAKFNSLNLENDHSFVADQARETHQRIKKIQDDIDVLQVEMIQTEKELAAFLKESNPDVKKLQPLVESLEAQYQRSIALKKMASENLKLLNDLFDIVAHIQQYQKMKRTFAKLDEKVKEKTLCSGSLRNQLTNANAHFKEIKEQLDIFSEALPKVIDFVKDEKSFYPDLDEENTFTKIDYNNDLATLGTCDIEITELLDNLGKIDEYIGVELRRIDQLEKEEEARAKAMATSASPTLFSTLSRSLQNAKKESGISPSLASAPSSLTYSEIQPKPRIEMPAVPPPLHGNCLAAQVCDKLKGLLQTRESLNFWESLTNYKTICFIKCGGKTVTSENGTEHRVQTGVSDMIASLKKFESYQFDENTAKKLILAILKNAQDGRKRSSPPGLKYGLFKAREDAVDQFYRNFLGDWGSLDFNNTNTENLDRLNDHNLQQLLDCLDRWDNRLGPASKRLPQSGQDQQRILRSVS